MKAMNTMKRTIGRLAAVAMVALVLIGLGAEATKAAPIGPFDFEYEADFYDLCTRGGGTYIDTGDGNLWCQWPNGTQTVCDTNGKDCWLFSVRPPQDSTGPLGDLAGGATLGEDPRGNGPLTGGTVLRGDQGVYVDKVADPAP